MTFSKHTELLGSDSFSENRHYDDILSESIYYCGRIRLLRARAVMAIEDGQNLRRALAAKSGQEEGDRAVWERPAVRRLATEYAEGGGPHQSEGNCIPGGTHSAKPRRPVYKSLGIDIKIISSLRWIIQ